MEGGLNELLRQIFNITVHLYERSEIKLTLKKYIRSNNLSLPDLS